jgi:mannosyl-oligosaccharide glucosidase
VSTPPAPSPVPHFGYVALFPLLGRLLPPASPELGKQLELLTDPNLLWSQYGLRSLAKTSTLYKKCACSLACLLLQPLCVILGEGER